MSNSENSSNFSFFPDLFFLLHRSTVKSGSCFKVWSPCKFINSCPLPRILGKFLTWSRGRTQATPEIPTVFCIPGQGKLVPSCPAFSFALRWGAAGHPALYFIHTFSQPHCFAVWPASRETQVPRFPAGGPCLSGATELEAGVVGVALGGVQRLMKTQTRHHSREGPRVGSSWNLWPSLKKEHRERSPQFGFRDVFKEQLPGASMRAFMCSCSCSGPWLGALRPSACLPRLHVYRQTVEGFRACVSRSALLAGPLAS